MKKLYFWIFVGLCITFLGLVPKIISASDIGLHWNSSTNKWMQHPTGATNLIAHARFTITDKAATHYLFVAATDEFSLYLNGKSIGGERSSSEFIAEKFDLSPFIRTGENHLYIHVSNSSRAQSAKLLSYLEAFHNERLQRLSLQWQVTENFPYPLEGASQHIETRLHTNWTSPHFIILDGHDVSNIGFPFQFNIATLMHDWLWSERPDDTRLNAKQNLTYNIGDELFIGVAVDGVYKVKINRNDLAGYNTKSKLFQVIDLTPFMKIGANTIEIEFHSTDITPKASIIGRHYHEGYIDDLGHPSQWEFDKPTRIVSAQSRRFAGLQYRPISNDILALRASFSHFSYLVSPLLLSMLLIYWVLNKFYPYLEKTPFVIQGLFIVVAVNTLYCLYVVLVPQYGLSNSGANVFSAIGLIAVVLTSLFLEKGKPRV